MASSSIVVAAGFIVFRRLQENVQYLLLQTSYGEHHWTPPKGHVDPGESELETALRETLEEAGLSDSQMNILPSFKTTLNYEVRGKPKRVVYWLSELKDPTSEVRLSDEHQDFKWLNFNQALDYAKYEDMQRAFREAHAYLQKYGHSGDGRT